MALRTKLKDTAQQLAGDLKVKDIRIGLCYTAVQLDNGQLGLAYTFCDSLTRGCSVFDTSQTIAGRPAKELLSLFDSDNLIASAVALATANALLNSSHHAYVPGPAVEQIQFYPDDQVGMIGNFSPLVRGIRPRVKQLYIFERQARLDESILGMARTEELLPKCQVALITATAIINGSIDRLLSLTANCRAVIILGTSTPLCRDVFEETPVTLLSGVVAKNAEKLLQVVSEGGGTPAFKQAVDKVNLVIGPNTQRYD